MKIIGALRVKNESRWIERSIQSLLPICERILVFDDHSDDDTPKLCASFPGVTVFHSPFAGLNEVRDKNFLMERIENVSAPGDWVCMIDGDEEIHSADHDQIRALAARGAGPDAYRFRILYLWDAENQMRVDGIYGRFTRPSFFRLRPGARFHSAVAGGFHCSNAPDPRLASECSVRILHWGYFDKELRVRKWNFYNSVDPKNGAEGFDARFPARRSYPHIVQGDIPEVPAEARLTHAGPLQLAPLNR